MDLNESIREMLHFTASPGVLFVRLLLAMVLGALLGWDRETKHKPAGLRTFMLVSVGSAGFVLMAVAMQHEEGGSIVDPSRVVQGVVGGLGFLCAGSIIHSRGHVKGLTTSAGIWVAGAVGSACGAGMLGLAIMLTFFGVLILAVLLPFSEAVGGNDNGKDKVRDQSPPKSDVE